MYQSLKLLPLATSLDDISNELINSGSKAMAFGNNTVRGIFDKVVVPSSLLVILLVVFFLIFSIVHAKRKKDGEGVEEKLGWLIVCFVVFGIIAGYGLIFGGLFDMILGGAA